MLMFRIKVPLTARTNSLLQTVLEIGVNVLSYPFRYLYWTISIASKASTAACAALSSR